MKTKFTFFILLMVVFSLSAQQASSKKESKFSSADYNRNSLSIVTIDNLSYDYLNALVQQWHPPLKYNYNELISPIIKSPFSSSTIPFRSNVVEQAENNTALFGPPKKIFFGPSKSGNSVAKAMQGHSIPNEIVGVWFNRQPDGSFNTETLQKRGLQNATFDDVKEADVSKRGKAILGDQGEQLISNSYMMTFAFSDVKPYSEDGSYGMQCNYKCWLYKLDFSDSVSAVFFDQMWITATDTEDERAAKVAAFNQFSFPLKEVLEIEVAGINSSFTASSSQPTVSREKQIKTLFESVVHNTLTIIENNHEKFRVRTPVVKTAPIRARIGSKESLKSESRYLVYELYQKRGKEHWKQKGAVRAKYVVNNEAGVGSDRMSIFYQISGRDIDPGMVLSQKNELGFSASGSYAMALSSEGIGGGEISLDYLFGKGINGVTGWRIGANIGFDAREYASLDDHGSSIFTHLPGTETYSFLRYDFYLSKSIFFARMFALTPKLGAGVEGATALDSDSYMENSISTFYGRGSVELSIALSYYLRIYGMATYYQPFGYAQSNESTVMLGSPTMIPDVLPVNTEAANYTDVFSGRKGLSLNFGIKIVI